MCSKLQKNIFIAIIAIFIALPSYCADWNALDRVNYVGTMITKRNSLPSSIKFELVNNCPNNRYAISSNTIQISKSDVECTFDDNELAYIISHELGEIIVKNLNPKDKFCDEPDIYFMGIDLMISAGYNPLAGISILEKFDKTDKAEHLYDYILYNYPSKIIAGYNSAEYNLFNSNIDYKIKERKSNKKKLAKYNKKQAKISKARFKRLAKYDPNISKLSSWKITKDLLKSITEPEEK